MPHIQSSTVCLGEEMPITAEKTALIMPDKGKSTARGIAALVVVIAHMHQIFLTPYLGPQHRAAQAFSFMADQSVMIFFIISGFLITHSIIENIKRNQGQFDIVAYAASRIARIYPPLCFAVLLSIIFYSVICFFSLPGSSADFPFGIGAFPPTREIYVISWADLKNTLFMHNGLLEVNGPLWSLFVEWRIYILAGTLAWLIKANGTMQKIIIFGIFIYSCRKLLNINEHSLFYLQVWLIGSITSLVLHKLLKWKLPNRKFVLIVLCLIILGWVCSTPDLITAGGTNSSFQRSAFRLLTCVFWCSLLFYRLPAIAKQIPLARWLGNFSYSLYILHFPIMLFFLSVFHTFATQSFYRCLIVGVLSVIASVVTANLSARLLETKQVFQSRIETCLILGVKILKNIFYRRRRYFAH